MLSFIEFVTSGAGQILDFYLSHTEKRIVKRLEVNWKIFG
jgi:hypothetical protein